MRGCTLKGPALQNIPLRTEAGRRAMELFHPVPECENMRMVREINEDPLPGRVFQMIDFSAIELRIAADLGLTAEAFLRQ